MILEQSEFQNIPNTADIWIIYKEKDAASPLLFQDYQEGLGMSKAERVGDGIGTAKEACAGCRQVPRVYPMVLVLQLLPGYVTTDSRFKMCYSEEWKTNWHTEWGRLRVDGGKKAL